MRPVGQLIDLFQIAEEIRLLNHQRGDVLPAVGLAAIRAVRPGADRNDGLEHDVLMAGDRPRHLRVGGIHGCAAQDAPRIRGPIRAYRHQAGFGQGRSAVVQRRVRHLHAGQSADHGLIFVDQLQGALTRLRLVGRVGGVEFAARGDCPHGRRNVMFVGTRADEIQGRPSPAARSAISRAISISPSSPAARRACRARKLAGNLVEQIVDRLHADESSMRPTSSGV